MVETRRHERRQDKRIPFIKEVEVIGVGMFRCTNLSARAMYLETAYSFPLGTVLDLRFKLHETDEHLINVQARVAHSHEGSGFGLYFFSLMLEHRKRIEKFIEQT